MKKIALSGKKAGGRFIIVDDEDYLWLNHWKWNLNSNGRARRTAIKKDNPSGNQTILLHRQILGFPKKIIDHVNGDPLDNRKANLRVCTISQNGFNRGKQRNNRSGYKGVWWHPSTNKWRVAIGLGNREYKYLGLFEDKEEAAKVYDAAAKKYHGEFVKTNFI